MPQSSVLQPASELNLHSPQLVSSLISGQSGLLSHRYSMRIHVPSPHLCSSGMQGLTSGLTGRDGEGQWGGWATCTPRLRYHVKPREAGHNSHRIRSKHKQDEELQRTVRINAMFWFYTGCKSRKKKNQHNTNKQTTNTQTDHVIWRMTFLETYSRGVKRFLK